VHDCTDPAGKWSDWVQTGSTCHCVPDAQDVPSACPANFTGSVNKHRDFVCPDAKWTAWTTTSNCTCKPSVEQKDFDCPDGFDGKITKTRSVTCPDGTLTDWVEKTNTCTPRPPATCVWGALGSGEISDAPVGKKAGSTCTCGDPPKGCYRSSGGSYLNYTACQCGG
jgi:hypothetical protein